MSAIPDSCINAADVASLESTPTMRPRLFDPTDIPQPLPFDPWAEEGDEANTLGVRQYYELHVLPTLRAVGTIDDYDRAVRRWEAFCQAFPISLSLPHCVDKHRIAYPVLASVTSKSLTAFQKWLVESGVPARATNKSIGCIRAVISHASKRGKMGRAPGISMLQENKAATIYTIDHKEFSRVYHACDVTNWPTMRRTDEARPGRWKLPYSPAVGWRALLVMLVTYGMRTEDAAAYTADASPLRWRDIRKQANNPHPAGKLSNRWGWLVFTPTKTQTKKPEPLVLPLTPLVRWHLDQLDPDGTASPSDFVFDWPLTAGTAKTSRYGYYPQFSRIFSEAGVAARDWAGDVVEYKPNHLRKTCVTWHETNLPGSSQYITGHSSNRSPDATLTSVQRKHYFNAEGLTMDALMTCPILAGWSPVSPADPKPKSRIK